MIIHLNESKLNAIVDEINLNYSLAEEHTKKAMEANELKELYESKAKGYRDVGMEMFCALSVLLSDSEKGLRYEESTGYYVK